MAAVLDVWVAKPGSACLVDDDSWLVRVFDAHGNIFTWGGTTYSNLAAPHAHWAGTIPPGSYVVQAVNEKTGVETDHAIADVGCDGLVCVHLYVAGTGREHPCKIAIKDVTGIGEPAPKLIQVAGTAANCSQVKVNVACATGATNSVVVPVSGGTWTAKVPTNELRCHCGRPVTIHAECVDDPKCFDDFKTEKLTCKSD